jgi:hypothetical protein
MLKKASPDEILEAVIKGPGVLGVLASYDKRSLIGLAAALNVWVEAKTPQQAIAVKLHGVLV